MLSIVYVSAATKLVDRTELERLIRQCRLNNEKAGITGLLLYVDGSFMQAVEGPEEAVRALQEKLLQDPRHRGVITILAENITERQFPNWAMALREKLDVPDEDRQALSQFLAETQRAGASDTTQRGAALKLLDGFRQSMV